MSRKSKRGKGKDKGQVTVTDKLTGLPERKKKPGLDANEVGRISRPLPEPPGVATERSDEGDGGLGGP